MDLGIKGKTALVVGASKGIGRAVALELMRDTVRVVGVARHNPTGTIGIELDLMEHLSAGYALAVRLIREHWEPDIIYHCMGGSWGGIKEWDRPWADYERVYRFNLGVAHEINRLLVPNMIERKWGRVVMTSSDCTKCNSGNPPYSSSKFALEGYVKTVSKQWAPHGVILTAVAPGNIYTPGLFTYSQGPEWTETYWKEHVAAHRWAQPEEIAKAILPLCGEPAAWMPGAVVRVDGGAR